MANCGRPTCHKCPTPPRCAAGPRCPKCHPKLHRQPNKFEQDYNRTKGRTK